MILDGIKNQPGMDRDSPVLLYEQGDHRIYWLGISENSIFRNNSYLIVDAGEAILLDPGGADSYSLIRQQIEKLMPVSDVAALLISHHGPHIAGSLAEWLEHYPDLLVISSPGTMVLLPGYGIQGFNGHDIEEQPEYHFKSGKRVQFYAAPFLHSPMSYVSFDLCSGYMFTGDVFASIDAEGLLVVRDFKAHTDKLDLFHSEYMASNKAAAGFVESIQDVPVKAFLPQHGSIISQQHVPQALDYLRNLQCGLDLTYPHLM